MLHTGKTSELAVAPKAELVGDAKEAEIADRLPEYKVSVIDDQANAVSTSDKQGAS